MKTDILIIGAGLTGLTTAYTLVRKGCQVMVLEQMDRLADRYRRTRSKDSSSRADRIRVRYPAPK